MPTSLDQATDAAGETASQDPVYAYKQTSLAAPLAFRLGPDGLHWDRVRLAGVVPYDRIRRIRMSFRPMTMQSYRFVTEIWPVEGPKLSIASTSARGIIEQERLDGQYRDFITELHRRIKTAGGDPRLEKGSNPFLYWVGAVVFAGAAVTMVGLLARGLAQSAWTGMLFVAAFLALFGWQAFSFFRRNMPGTYRADALPEVLLPRGKT